MNKLCERKNCSWNRRA